MDAGHNQLNIIQATWFCTLAFHGFLFWSNAPLPKTQPKGQKWERPKRRRLWALPHGFLHRFHPKSFQPKNISNCHPQMVLCALSGTSAVVKVPLFRIYAVISYIFETKKMLDFEICAKFWKMQFQRSTKNNAKNQLRRPINKHRNYENKVRNYFKTKVY